MNEELEVFEKFIETMTPLLQTAKIASFKWDTDWKLFDVTFTASFESEGYDMEFTKKFKKEETE